MTTLFPLVLALLGAGMFAGGLYLQLAEERARQRPEPVFLVAPAVASEDELVPQDALSRYPLVTP